MFLGERGSSRRIASLCFYKLAIDRAGKFLEVIIQQTIYLLESLLLRALSIIDRLQNIQVFPLGKHRVTVSVVLNEGFWTRIYVPEFPGGARRTSLNMIELGAARSGGICC